jgi:hypothetical protein
MVKELHGHDNKQRDDPSPTSRDSHPRRRTDLKTRLVEGELVVLDREGQMVHQLNRTASYIWQHCDGESSAAKIAEEVCQNFEIDYATALQDVLNTIEQLEKMKLLKDR